MNGLVELRADVAGRVRARLDAAGRNEAVVLDVRDADPPCVIVGIPTLAYIDGRVTVPVSMLAPGPGSGDALEWLQGSLEAVTGGGPLGPYRFVTADPVAVDVGDRSFPAYQVACSIPAPKTFCGNRLPGTPGPPVPRLAVAVVDQVDLTVTVDVTNEDPDGPPVTVRWGDGAANTLTEHTYATAGHYRITATQPGRLAAPPVDVTVTAPVIPQLVLTVTAQTDLTVTVDVTNDDTELPVSITWGDGIIDTNPIHNYTAAGTYTLVASQVGRLDSAPVDVTVTEPPPPPQLILAVTDTDDLTVTVDVTNDDTAQPVTITWGDSTTNTATVHTYATAGTYTLGATQPGRTPAAPINVTVTEPPPPFLSTLTAVWYGYPGSGADYVLGIKPQPRDSLVVLFAPGHTPPPTITGWPTAAQTGLTRAQLRAENVAFVILTEPVTSEVLGDVIVPIDTNGTNSDPAPDDVSAWHVSMIPNWDLDPQLRAKVTDAGQGTLFTYPPYPVT